jgi:hypothetical protein
VAVPPRSVRTVNTSYIFNVADEGNFERYSRDYLTEAAEKIDKNTYNM